ncbi:hypothetical protein N8I77_006944 [Diaporthe amygdali]|uniref:NB-ARC domain-containing protein n=1 Tax=Phomopsis amygdali TaxID=1214568 RepID=A0AAD9SHP4_PHOAM|nr:hypothetical protein N8I77_006944 [Diaporthe amygdali]
MTMAHTQQKRLARTSYHVAWICPVADLELLPAVLMLDEEHDTPDIDTHMDDNIYHFGSAAGHNVVLASCDQGMTGNVNVSSITAPLFKTFPNIRMTLLVGIGGGVPQPDTFSDPLNDLRLGDVVVGWPSGASGLGPVVHYESGRSRVDGFEITGTMDKPHKVLLHALKELNLRDELDRSTFHKYMEKLQRHKKHGNRFKHPGLDHDKLFRATYRHLGDYNSRCAKCDDGELVQREQRSDDDKDVFVYHQGRIATGNSVVMDGEKRDSISTLCRGALCIEMEAAGVEVNSRCLVIRGISDYADSHKSDLWRSYAAGKAVACARELLGVIPASDVKEKMAEVNKHWLVHRSTNPHFTGRRSVIDEIVVAISPEPIIDQQRRFVVTGMGGQGKSEICLHVANEVRDRFWAIFWVDVSTQNTAENNFSEVADALECPKSIDEVRKALSNLPPTRPWLLILDNADDLRRDHQIYMPSGNRGAILMTSRNPQCGRLAMTGGHKELDNLQEDECIQLLRRSSRLPESWQETSEDTAALVLVKELGYHTLAINHAGSFIATTRCSATEYLGYLTSNRQRIFERSGGQATSRYDTVYATFEASMEFLESSETGASDETRKDALQLLQILSTFHYESVPLDVLIDASDGSKQARQTPEEREMDSDVLTAGHVAQVPDLVKTEEDDAKFRITEAVAWLESLALVKTDSSMRMGVWKSVSMHPLVHGWARDRHRGEKKKAVLRMSQCIVALAHYAYRRWCPYHIQFRTHLRQLVDSDADLVDDAAQSRWVLQTCVMIAWTYHLMIDATNMYELTSRILQRLGVYDQKPTEELRGLYVVSALAVGEMGNRRAEAVRAFEKIARLDENTRNENDRLRLHNLRGLGNAYEKNGQTKQAVALLRKVVKARQELGEEHRDLLQAQHNLARALIRNNETEEAITLLERVIEIDERLLPAGHPDRLTSEHNLAVAYLKNGQIAEATPRLEELARHYAETHGEEHPGTAGTLSWLADAYEQAGRVTDAMQLYEQVVTIRKQILDEKHPHLLDSQNNLALAYLRAERVPEAIEILERVIEVARSWYDEGNPGRVRSQKLLDKAYAMYDHPSLRSPETSLSVSRTSLPDPFSLPEERPSVKLHSEPEVEAEERGCERLGGATNVTSGTSRTLREQKKPAGGLRSASPAALKRVSSPGSDSVRSKRTRTDR